MIKLGSLFDGSGGFPLAGSLCGFEPVWASEVEPYPIAVTRSRFPKMKHLGDISKINGAEIEPVDIITFGSPCQGLSQAGLREGLLDPRSGMFFHAVRVIKEMREATNGLYPTFALWENVPGAFSSNKGEDFRVVLEELIKIVEERAVMPVVPKNGWPYADCYRGDGWSIAYRTFDAQYWGVPQRRRRIHLVADFRGRRAGKVLFERKGLRGYFEKSIEQREDAARNAESGVGTADYEKCIGVDAYNQTLTGNKTKTLNSVAVDSDHVPCVLIGTADRKNGVKAYGFPLGFRPENVRVYDETATTLCNGTRAGFCNGIILGQYLFENHSQDSRYKGPLDVCPMLPAQLGTGGNNQPFVVSCIDGDKIGKAEREGGSGLGIRDGAMYTLTAKDKHAVCYSIGKEPICVKYIVRRLTPTECARLQGFPDKWGHPDKKDELTDEEYAFWREVRNTHAAINGKVVKEYTKAQMLAWYNKLHTDSAEYKMYGNGIALPVAVYCMQGIAEGMK